MVCRQEDTRIYFVLNGAIPPHISNTTFSAGFSCSVLPMIRRALWSLHSMNSPRYENLLMHFRDAHDMTKIASAVTLPPRQTSSLSCAEFHC